MTKQDDLDKRKRDRLDRKEIARLKAFSAQLAKDAESSIAAISPDDWERAQTEDVEGDAERLATAD